MQIILFNGGGLTSDQWIKIQGRTSNIIDRLNKFGEVFKYDPMFYLTDTKNIDMFMSDQKSKKSESTDYLFRMKDLDIENHCKFVYESANKYFTFSKSNNDQMLQTNKKYFLISHSRGQIYAHVFGMMYSDEIIGYINIDGGKPNDEINHRLKQIIKSHTMSDFSKVMNDADINIDKITDDDLYKIFDFLKKTYKSQELKSSEKIISLINRIVEYHQYKGYMNYVRDHYHNKLLFPTFILNNIYDDDEINIQMPDYVGTTLKWKFEFNRTQHNFYDFVKSIWYVGKKHWLYTFDDVLDDIEDIITKLIKNTTSNNNDSSSIDQRLPTIEKSIYIARHGETEWNKKGFAQGNENDIKLNDNGINQAKDLGLFLKSKNVKLDLIISSPMIRTIETSNIVADVLEFPKKNIITMDQLIEVGLGLLAIGKTVTELHEDKFYDEFFTLMDEYEKLDNLDKLELSGDIPEVFIEKYKMESNENVYKRVRYVIDYVKSSDKKNILIVSHNGTINFINKTILNSVDIIKGDLSKGKNCHLTLYKLKDGIFKLIMAPTTFFIQTKTKP
jgi:broad specificity phosphatase PhoE